MSPFATFSLSCFLTFGSSVKSALYLLTQLHEEFKFQRKPNRERDRNKGKRQIQWGDLLHKLKIRKRTGLRNFSANSSFSDGDKFFEERVSRNRKDSLRMWQTGGHFVRKRSSNNSINLSRKSVTNLSLKRMSKMPFWSDKRAVSQQEILL